MKATVFYVVESPFVARDRDRFGIEIMRQAGFNIRVLDISPLVAPMIYQHHSGAGTITVIEGYEAIESKAQFAEAAKLIQGHDIVLAIISVQLKTRFYWRALQRAGARVGALALGQIPSAAADRAEARAPLWRALPRKAKNLVLDPAKLAIKLFDRTPPAFWGFKPLDFLAAGGEAAKSGHPLIAETSKLLWCHSFDYDLYLKELREPEPAENGFAVYLDTFCPSHPDFIHSGMGFPCTSEQYYPPMRRFFDWVEKNTGRDVVIAAHPKANYSDRRGCFGDRKIVFNQTARLVRASSLVLNEGSTAISFAVLFGKPVLPMNYSFLRGTFEYLYFNAAAESLGKKPVMLDEGVENIDFKQLARLDPVVYERYKRLYLKTPGSPEKPIWQIVADYCLTR